MQLLLNILVLTALMPGVDALAHTAQFRSDLQLAAPVFCGESTLSLAASSVFDAQIELAFVGSVADMDRFAKHFAEQNGHSGYGFGNCQDHRQWIVSTPSSAPILAVNPSKTSVFIHSEALRKDCASFDVDALVQDVTQPVALLKNKVPDSGISALSLTAVPYTSLSLTCHPPLKASRGPELWAFLALQPAPAMPRLNSEHDLLQWLRKQRADSGLPSLAMAAEPLQKVADEAARQQDLHHPRALLLDSRARLRKRGIVILGENRATAESYSDLGSLLWNSPQHRRLLLHSKANAIALNTSVLPNRSEKLLVMILAKQ